MTIPAKHPLDSCQRCGILDTSPEREQDIRMTVGARALCAECRDDLALLDSDVEPLIRTMPEPGKIYRLTGAGDTPSVARGDKLEDCVVDPKQLLADLHRPL